MKCPKSPIRAIGKVHAVARMVHSSVGALFPLVFLSFGRLGPKSGRQFKECGIPVRSAVGTSGGTPKHKG